MRLLLLVSLVSCSLPERAWVALPPQSEEAKAIVIAVRDPKLRVFAYPIDRAEPISIPLALSEDAREIEAVLFEETLPVGPGEVAEGAGASLRDLPGRLGVYTALRNERDFGAWIEEDAMSQDLGDFRLSPILDESDCGMLEGSRLHLPTAERALFVLPYEGALLVGTNDARLFRVYRDRYEELRAQPAVRLDAAASDAMGRLFFASTAARSFTLWSGVIDAELELTPIATSSSGAPLRIAVSRTDPLEIVVIDRDATWHRYDGTKIEMIRASDDPTETSKLADLEVLAPGHVVGVHADFDVIFRYRDGRVSVEVLPAIPDRMRGLAYVPGLGTVVTTFNQAAWVNDGNQWRRLGSTSFELPPAEVVPLEGGFLVGSELGAVEEFRIASGFCADRILPTQGEPAIIGAPYEGGAAFTNTYSRGSRDLQVTFVRRGAVSP